MKPTPENCGHTYSHLGLCLESGCLANRLVCIPRQGAEPEWGVCWPRAFKMASEGKLSVQPPHALASAGAMADGNKAELDAALAMKSMYELMKEAADLRKQITQIQVDGMLAELQGLIKTVEKAGSGT